ncbi:MAG: DJ-1/PfpI family protein [Opitutales bacterium]|nr:DJ-1/PfpI family protein [Opitutales bacterium]
MNTHRSHLPHLLRGIVALLVAAGSLPSVTFADAEDTDSPRLLFLIAHGFNRMEHFESLYSLTAMGYNVDVASFAAGTVLLDPNNETPDRQGRDALANLAMREVTDISPYLGLVLPGGYSPGNLEDDPEAIRIVRTFDAAEKPIGSICHSARLLAGAGVAAGRMVTGWNEIASEVPEAWMRGDLGTYIDQPVVVDGHIVSCRYPDDVRPWFHAFAEHLAGRGGIKPPRKRADAVFLAGHKESGHQRQMTTLGGRNNHVFPNVIHSAESLAANLERDPSADIVFVYPNEASEALLHSKGGQALLTALGNPTVHRLAENESPMQLREAVAVAREVGRPLPDPEPVAHDAVIALSPGFDDRVAPAIEAFLRHLGFNPVHLSHERGWVRGLNGLPVYAAGTYTEPPLLAERILVVAPGGLWPREDPNVRQADQPPWLAGQAERDARRAAWITDRYKEGGVLVTFGFDSLYVTGDPVFAGIPFAASDQIPYAFIWRRHSVAEYAPDVEALRSAERIYSARGFEALPELMRLLEQPAAAALLHP